MVKFRTEVDSGYQSVRGKVQEFIEEAEEARKTSGMLWA
jgi:hypothetical protein